MVRFLFWKNSFSVPRWLSGKESACNAGDTRDRRLIPRWGRSPGRRQIFATPAFLPGESHGQRSLVRYSPQGSKELDRTEVTERVCLAIYCWVSNHPQKSPPYCLALNNTVLLCLLTSSGFFWPILWFHMLVAWKSAGGWSVLTCVAHWFECLGSAAFPYGQSLSTCLFQQGSWTSSAQGLNDPCC